MNKPASPMVITITIDENTSFELRPDEITATISRKVREATGISLRKAMELLSSDPDLDVFAAICYAAALQTNPNYPFDDIEAKLTYDTSLEVDVADDDGDMTDPET